MNTCATPDCGRPRDTKSLCHRCTGRLTAQLHELQWQLPHLRACLYPDRSPTTGTIHGGRAHSPLPARADVLNLLGAGSNSATLDDPYSEARGDQDGPIPIDTMLRGWAEMLAAHIRLAPTPWRRPGHTWVAWHIAYLPWTITAEWAGLFHHELTDVLTRVRAITHTEPQRHLQDAPCPSCQAFGLVDKDWANYIECVACGTLLTHAEYADHARRVLPGLYRTALQLVVAHAQDGQPTSA
jgi:Zn ribbon nucleic-acid-binding protein